MSVTGVPVNAISVIINYVPVGDLPGDYWERIHKANSKQNAFQMHEPN